MAISYRLPVSALNVKSVAWVALTAAIIGGGLYLAQSFSAVGNENRQREAQDVAIRMSQALARTLEQAVAGGDAEHDRVAALLDAGRSEDIAAKEVELAAGSDRILRVRLLEAGEAKIDTGSWPPLGYSALEILRRSENTGNAQPAVVVGERPHVLVARRVMSGERLSGHILYALDASIVDDVVRQVGPSQGYTQVRQMERGRTGRVLMTLGDATDKIASGPDARHSAQSTQWEVAYWHPASTREGVSSSLGALLGFVGAIALGAFGYVLWANFARRVAGRTERWSPQAPSTGAGGSAQAPDVVENVVGSDDEPFGSVDTGEDVEVVDIAASIFRAYDVRGIVGETLTVDSVRLIGQAIASEAHAREQQVIVVGRDGRSSGPELADALIEGILAAGKDVIDVGQVPTPVLYFATYHLNTGSGVMVTGSHNPPEYNGLKIMLGGDTLFGDDVAALRERIMAGDLSAGEGKQSSVDIIPAYIRRVSEDIPIALGNPLKVVIDCGNGVAGGVAPKLIRALGHDVIELYCEVDGTFPNHHPDPSQPENLGDLIDAVAKHKADIGFAFDGDGDRIGVVDSSGEVLWPDRQMMLYAKDVLSRNAGAEIVYDVKCSSRLAQVIEDAGGEPVMWKTGHSFMKNKLKETGSPLAGEMSGHIFFKERWYGFDDAIYSAARMLEILMADGRAPHQIFAELPCGYSTPEMRVDFAEGEHTQFMQRLSEGDHFAGGKLTTIDGIRVDYADGWGLVRASNTTPSLVLRFEGDTPEALERIKGQFRDILLELGPELTLPI